jgi:PIF1-like helicase
LAELIKLCKLVVWDEAPMCNKYVFETVDRCFKDIMKNSELFGGKTIVLGGDFRQILPVVVHGTRKDIVSSSLKRSYIWKHVHIRRLTINMRTTLGSDETKEKQQEFMDYLLRIGDGKEKTIRLSANDNTYEDVIQIKRNAVKINKFR